MQRLARQIAPMVIIVTVVVVYASLNLGRLGVESYWTDELLSVGYANARFGEMLNHLATDWHPPAYNTIVWFAIRLTNSASEAVVRSISLFAIAVGVAALAAVTWRRIGSGSALVFLVLATTSSLVASFAREARPHGLAFAAICLTTAIWLELLGNSSHRGRNSVLLAAAGGAAALTSYYAFLVYALEVAVLVGWLALRGRRSEIVTVAVATAISVVPTLLWINRSWQALGSSSTPPLSWAWAELVAGLAAEPYTTAVAGLDQARHGLAIVGGTFALAAVLIAAMVFVASRRGPDLGTGALLGAACLIVAGSAVAASVVESLVLAPSFHSRSLVSALPPLYVGLGAATSLPFGRRAQFAGVAIAVLLVALARVTPEPTLPPSPKDDWRQAAAYVVSEVHGGLPVERVATVASPWGESVDWVLSYNLASGRGAPAADLPADLRYLYWIYSADDVAAMPQGSRMVLVAFHFWAWERHAQIVTAVQDRFGPCDDLSVTGITLLSCSGVGDPAHINAVPDS